jgi:hypothetical protein
VIILGPDGLSELIRRVPNPGVVVWLGSPPADEVATTALRPPNCRTE